MIRLSVNLDGTLVRALSDVRTGERSWEEVWSSLCEEQKLLLRDAKLFDLPDAIAADDIERMEEQLVFLQQHAEQSVRHMEAFFPDTPGMMEHRLRVVFLPYGNINYGPREGLQLYSLFPTADIGETYLFLMHVYYHEISFLNYTSRAAAVSVARETGEDYKEWIRLLIRNEGIGNYAVLEPLRQWREWKAPEYAYHYFSYADDLGSQRLLVKCFETLNTVFSLPESAFERYKDQTVNVLKTKELPAINVIGTHMASCIAESHGLDALRNVYRRDASEFFRLYEESGDSLAKRLTAVMES